MTDLKMPKLWTETEVAAYFGVSRGTIKRERLRGRLKFTRIATNIRFTDGQIMEYINSREAMGKEATTVTTLKAVK